MVGCWRSLLAHVDPGGAHGAIKRWGSNAVARRREEAPGLPGGHGTWPGCVMHARAPGLAQEGWGRSHPPPARGMGMEKAPVARHRPRGHREILAEASSWWRSEMSNVSSATSNGVRERGYVEKLNLREGPVRCLQPQDPSCLRNFKKSVSRRCRSLQDLSPEPA